MHVSPGPASGSIGVDVSAPASSTGVPESAGVDVPASGAGAGVGVVASLDEHAATKIVTTRERRMVRSVADRVEFDPDYPCALYTAPSADKMPPPLAWETCMHPCNRMDRDENGPHFYRIRSKSMQSP
jgi:hypothetical protein